MIGLPTYSVAHLLDSVGAEQGAMVHTRSEVLQLARRSLHRCWEK